MPSGMEIASFSTYLEAQRAVDMLSDNQFPVQHTTIVGADLRMVERITGRLSYPRVALAGAVSGAWFGLFVGLLLGLLSENFMAMMLPALLIGAAFGMLFGLVSYAFTGGKRDFTSSSQVVASAYALLCAPEHAGDARQMLSEAGIRSTGVSPESAGGGTPSGTVPAPVTSGEEPAQRPAFRPWQDEHGNPRYGQRLPDEPAAPENQTDNRAANPPAGPPENPSGRPPENPPARPPENHSDKRAGNEGQ